MARLAVLASGSGSNFEAIALAMAGSGHELAILVCDRKDAFVFERARRLGVNSRYLRYAKRERAEAERELSLILEGERVDLVALAGFMRILSPDFVARWEGRVVNVHPSPLPAYPGVDSVERMYEAGERVFGVTVHLVDAGMDSGPILARKTLERGDGDTLESVTARIHSIEHELYPSVIIELLGGA